MSYCSCGYFKYECDCCGEVKVCPECNGRKYVVQVHQSEGTVFINLPEHKPVVISAEEEYRKGIEVDFCSECGNLSTILSYLGKEKYCRLCSLLGCYKCPNCNSIDTDKFLDDDNKPTGKAFCQNCEKEFEIEGVD